MDSEQFRSMQESFNRADFMADLGVDNKQQNTPAEIYAQVRNRALEDAAKVAERVIQVQTGLEFLGIVSHTVNQQVAQAIRALKHDKETE